MTTLKDITVTKTGNITCHVTGGCVNINFGGVDQGNRGIGQGVDSSPWTKPHGKNDPSVRVKVTQVGTAIVTMTFNSP